MIKNELLLFDRVYGPKHENHIQFHFGGNLFDLGGFKNCY